MGMDQHMKAALDEARKGAAEGGIPIGAALVDREGNLVATGRNRRVQGRAVVVHEVVDLDLDEAKELEAGYIQN